MAWHFSKHLKGEIEKLRSGLPEAGVIHVDMYSAKYELISNAKNEVYFNMQLKVFIDLLFES